MTITVEIPDQLAGILTTDGKDPVRTVLEAVALDGYRTNRLSEYEVQQLLGFESRMDVHGFLKEHGVYLHYTLDDLEHDLAEARRYSTLTEAQQPIEQRAG
jgi:hypothetical protein